MQSTAARGMVAAGLAIVILLITTAAFAAKPGPGTPTGTASVFVSNPVEDLNNQSLRDQKDSAAAVPAAAYHTVTLTDLDGSGFLRGAGRRSSAKPAIPRTRPRTRSSTTGARTSSSRSWPTTGSPSRRSTSRASASARRRPVNKEPQGSGSTSTASTTRSRRPQGRDPAREGRRRRRRGRRGDPPRVRPRDPLLAELRVRVGRGRLDQRGLRRLLGRHGRGRRQSSLAPLTDRHASPTGTRRPTIRRRRTACAGWTRTSTTRRTSSARCMPTGGSGRERCGTSARRSAT